MIYVALEFKRPRMSKEQRIIISATEIYSFLQFGPFLPRIRTNEALKSSLFFTYTGMVHHSMIPYYHTMPW